MRKKLPPFIRDIFKIKKFTISTSILTFVLFGFIGKYIYPVDPNNMWNPPELHPARNILWERMPMGGISSHKS